jgi:CheY-like chemotaxis protein
MLVEDDTDDQHLFSYCMQKICRDYKCIIANNGKEALDMLTEIAELPDIIFMDINMPVVDGYSCLKRVKENMKFSSIPVIVFSTAHKEFAEDTALKLGACKFIQKPLELDNFCKVIEEAINLALPG